MIRMDIAAALDAFVAIAAVAIMFAIGITIYDELKARRKGKELVGEAVAEEAEEEPKRPNILQRIIKPREEEGTKERDDGNIRIVLEMPRVIHVKVDPNDLIAYLFSSSTKKKAPEVEEGEAEEGDEGEEEGRVSTEVLLRKGLVKEG